MNCLGHDPYSDLAVAIVTQAVNDYEKAYSMPRGKCKDFNKQEIEKFFRSKYCKFLTGGVNANKIMPILRLRGRYAAWRLKQKCDECKLKPSECVHRTGDHYTAMEKGELECVKREKEAALHADGMRGKGTDTMESMSAGTKKA